MTEFQENAAILNIHPNITFPREVQLYPRHYEHTYPVSPEPNAHYVDPEPPIPMSSFIDEFFTETNSWEAVIPFQVTINKDNKSCLSEDTTFEDILSFTDKKYSKTRIYFGTAFKPSDCILSFSKTTLYTQLWFAAAENGTKLVIGGTYGDTIRLHCTRYRSYNPNS